MQTILEKLFQAQVLSQQESQQLFSAICARRTGAKPTGRRPDKYESSW